MMLRIDAPSLVELRGGDQDKATVGVIPSLALHELDGTALKRLIDWRGGQGIAYVGAIPGPEVRIKD